MDIGIKIIIAVVVILVLIGIKMVCDEKARRKRMREFLINSWGKSADRNYSEEQWNAIVSYYKVLEKRRRKAKSMNLWTILPGMIWIWIKCIRYGIIHGLRSGKNICMQHSVIRLLQMQKWKNASSDHISVGEYTGTHVFTGGACRDRKIRTNVRV